MIVSNNTYSTKTKVLMLRVAVDIVLLNENCESEMSDAHEQILCGTKSSVHFRAHLAHFARIARDEQCEQHEQENKSAKTACHHERVRGGPSSSFLVWFSRLDCFDSLDRKNIANTSVTHDGRTNNTTTRKQTLKDGNGRPLAWHSTLEA